MARPGAGATDGPTGAGQGSLAALIRSDRRRELGRHRCRRSEMGQIVPHHATVCAVS